METTCLPAPLAFSQRQAAKILDVNRQTVSDLIVAHKLNHRPTRADIEALARLLATEVDWSRIGLG